MRVLRAAYVWIAVVLLTIGFGVPAIFAAYLPPRGDWFLWFARGWARCLLAVGGVSVRVLHPERALGGRSFVVAANHASYADIAVLLARLPLPARFLAKRSIFRVPILGWSIAAAGFVPVDRGDRSRGIATVDAAMRRLRRGRSVVVFPEETRTRTGELLPFKAGAALLARRSGLAILPVGIAGTRTVLPAGSSVISPGRVAVSVGDPIPADDGRARELTAKVRDEIERLRREAEENL